MLILCFLICNLGLGLGSPGEAEGGRDQNVAGATRTDGIRSCVPGAWQW